MVSGNDGGNRVPHGGSHTTCSELASFAKARERTTQVVLRHTETDGDFPSLATRVITNERDDPRIASAKRIVDVLSSPRTGNAPCLVEQCFCCSRAVVLHCRKYALLLRPHARG
jgi:hypothetical protein